MFALTAGRTSRGLSGHDAKVEYNPQSPAEMDTA
jgi:hypothetical protein